ncbi:Kiwa anti-phage protein KwaB-like domain-containing protein [Proteus mirabilis]|uniref:Kiwa anti-phage protein KwaB-like domain-containing protein n=1 Tax=Proteus mirabilis TaxID=584 RepID=UPI0034D5EB2B
MSDDSDVDNLELEHDSDKASEIIDYYDNFLPPKANKEDVTLCVYFGFDNGDDGYSVKLADFSPQNNMAIKEKILSGNSIDPVGFLSESRDCISKESVTVTKIDHLVDGKMNISFMSDADSYENEKVSRLFNIIDDSGAGDTLEKVNFNDGDDVLKIDSIFFVLSVGEFRILLYKRQYRVQNFSKHRKLFKYHDSKLITVDEDMISIDINPSVVLFKKDLFIYNLKVFEDFFGYKVLIEKRATDFIDEISTVLDDVADYSSLKRRVIDDSDSFRKKLAKISKYPNTITTLEFLSKDKSKFSTFISNNAYLTKVLKYQDAKISLETKNQQTVFIALISDGVLKSELTGNDYIAPANKKKI